MHLPPTEQQKWVGVVTANGWDVLQLGEMDGAGDEPQRRVVYSSREEPWMLKLGVEVLQGVRSWAARGWQVFSQCQENILLCLRRKKNTVPH